MRIIGDRVILRPIEEADLPTVLPWRNDPEVMYPADDNPNPHMTLSELKERHQREIGEWSDYMERFIIETHEGAMIGDVYYSVPMPRAGGVNIGLVIGVKSYRGRGYGTDVIRLLIKYLFEQKRVHKVACTISDFNVRSIRAFEKCGFKKEGVLRHDIVVDGRYVDHVVMGILEDEYRSLFGGSDDRGAPSPTTPL
jgi:ribosomal-protein-alanine N-acetyltransferase